jgi:hypothetical protein
MIEGYFDITPDSGWKFEKLCFAICVGALIPFGKERRT